VGTVVETRPVIRPDLRSLPSDAWSAIHKNFEQQAPAAVPEKQAKAAELVGTVVETRPVVRPDLRSLPSDAWAAIHARFGAPVPAAKASSPPPPVVAAAVTAELALPKAEEGKEVAGPLPASGLWQFEEVEPGLIKSAPSEVEVPTPELSRKLGGAFASGSMGSGASSQPPALPGGIRRDPAQPKEAYIRDLKDAINAKEAKLKALAAKIQELTNASP